MLSSREVVPIDVVRSRGFKTNLARVFGWRGLLSIAAVCLLTLIVVTRYYGPGDPFPTTGHSVKTRLAEPKAQRLLPPDEVTHGMLAAQSLSTVPVRTSEPRMATASAPVPPVDHDDTISDRAPPRSTLL